MPWPRNGWKYQGDPEVGRRVFVAENPDDGWGPGPRVTTDSLNEISAETGSATFTPMSNARTQAVVVLGALVLLTGVAVWGRKMR